MIPLAYTLRSLRERRATTLAAVAGIGLVVFVLAASLMLDAGIRRALGASGRPDRAIVMRKGSNNELSSGVEKVNVGLVAAQPGVRAAAGEVVIVVLLAKVGGAGMSNAQLRGVPAESATLRPEVKIVQGRAPRPGSDEALVGARILGRFEGLGIGQQFELRKGRSATVVGAFEAGGSSLESEVWLDVDTVRQAFRREGMVSSVCVGLESPAAFDAFEAAVEHDKRLGLEAMRESEYLARISEGTAKFIGILSSVTTFFFAIGAVIGAMITMYAAVAHRRREIGVLRALGFPRRSILAAFLLESALVALLGGALGVVGALGMGAVEFSMVNQDSWAEMVFAFVPTPATIVTALAVALVMGLVGGILPAFAAARLRPVLAMRD